MELLSVKNVNKLDDKELYKYCKFIGKNVDKLDDKELYKYCQFVGKNARQWKNRFVALLPEVARRGIHKKKGFATIVKFAAVVGGIEKGTVEAVFQVEKHIGDKPALKEILPKVGVSKMRVIATIATKDNQEDLAKKVMSMPKNVLELVARNYRSKIEEEKWRKIDGNNNDEIRQILPGEDLHDQRVVVRFDVHKKVRLDLEKFKLMIEKEKKEALTWEEVMKELLVRATITQKALKQTKSAKKTSSKSKTSGTTLSQSKNKSNGSRVVIETKNKSEPEKTSKSKSHPTSRSIQTAKQSTKKSTQKKNNFAKKQENPERSKKITTSKELSRTIPTAKQREEIDKYNGKCAIQECNKAAIEFHHPTRFSLKQSHETIVPLCKTHHQAAHFGLIKNEDMSPEYWKMQHLIVNNDLQQSLDKNKIKVNHCKNLQHPSKTDSKNYIDKKFQQKLMEYLL